MKIQKLLIFCACALVFAACQKEEPTTTDSTTDDSASSDTEPAKKVVYGVPTISIETDGSAEITSKTEFVGCRVQVFEDGDFKNPIHSVRGRIRGRGNATWWWYDDKRPYKLKLDEAYDMCGMPANKDWALLALHSDHSLVRESYSTCLATKLEMPYQIRQEYVRIVLNGVPQGIYIISETVENAKNRVDVKKDGFILEKDNHTELETLVFTSVKGHTFTFKYPDDDDMQADDDNYKFITQFINNWETALYSEDFADPEKGYRKYMEPVSFAKWYILQELCNNYEPNPFYVLKSRDDLLEAGPTWDAEWSFGLSFQDENGWCYPPVQPSATTSIWTAKTYYRIFFKDPYFVNLVKEEWAKLKPQLPAVHEEMDQLYEDLTPAAKHNFSVHQVLGEYPKLGLVRFNSWKDEVNYVSTYLDEHAEWMDEFIAAM